MRAPGAPAPWEFIGPAAGMFNTVVAALRYSSICCSTPIGNVMPYVKRNAAGAIIGLLDRPEAGAGEELSLDSEEIQAFFGQARQRLSLSDVETIRVIEDVVDVLIRKKLLLLTDLPQAAQKKLMERQRMRSELGALGNLVIDEEDIL
jgi:hypothetical protein